MKLFVYGTLREGAVSNEKYLNSKIVSKEIGFVKGTLYNIKNRIFPALTAGDRMIIGDIYTLEDDFDFSDMDAYEEYYGEGNKSNLYDRVLLPIYDKSGVYKCDAYVYLYNMRADNAKEELGSIIESNDYLKR